jgi:hypothetical protein
MNEHAPSSRLRRAAETFNDRAKRDDGARIVCSLDSGLNLLRDTLFLRLHADVERRIGLDSMLVPVSEAATALAAKQEIEIFQVAQSVAVVRQHRFLPASDDWFLDWLTCLRLNASYVEPSVKELSLDYLAHSYDDRRLTFTNVLAKTIRESGRAPLVIFKLYPLAVEIAALRAFGDHAGAELLRRRQAELLPSVRDCPDCRGVVLENGEHCGCCGNPLWTNEYLTAAD